MTSPANYCIRQNGEHELYYSRWGGMVVPHEVFYGPEQLEQLIREQERVHKDEWTPWCEGGVALDKDRRTLVLYGGESIGEPPLRTVYLDLLRALWRSFGWTARWAERDLIDIAAQVGAEDLVAALEFNEPSAPPLEWITAFGPDSYPMILVSVRNAAGEWSERVTRFPLFDRLLAVGAPLIDLLPQLPTLDEGRRHGSDKSVTLTDGLEGRALCMDSRERVVVAYDEWPLAHGQLAFLRELWPGWSLRERTGGIAQMFADTGRAVPGDLVEPGVPPTRNECLQQVCETLLGRGRLNPTYLRRLLELEPNAQFLEHVPDRPPTGLPPGSSLDAILGRALACLGETPE